VFSVGWLIGWFVLFVLCLCLCLWEKGMWMLGRGCGCWEGDVDVEKGMWMLGRMPHSTEELIWETCDGRQLKSPFPQLAAHKHKLSMGQCVEHVHDVECILICS
jgi:hypothetical protein